MGQMLYKSMVSIDHYKLCFQKRGGELYKIKGYSKLRVIQNKDKGL